MSGYLAWLDEAGDWQQAEDRRRAVRHGVRLAHPQITHRATPGPRVTVPPPGWAGLGRPEDVVEAIANPPHTYRIGGRDATDQVRKWQAQLHSYIHAHDREVGAEQLRRLYENGWPEAQG